VKVIDKTFKSHICVFSCTPWQLDLVFGVILHLDIGTSEEDPALSRHQNKFIFSFVN